MTAAEYVLTADFLPRLDDKGVMRELRRGAILADLSDDDVRRLVSAGAAVERGAYEQEQADRAAAAAAVAADEDTDSGDSEPPADAGMPAASSGQVTRPKTAATTDVWRAYAIATGIPEADAEGMTKAQLIKATR